MPEFRMPSLGADMEAGTVLVWHVQPGDRVRRGQVVMLVDTDKAEIETEIWEDGVVAEILVPVGQHVPVGTPLLRLEASAGAGAEPAPPTPPAAPAAPATRPAPSAPLAAAAAPAPASPRVAASPHARRIARERGIDLATLAGSGPHGAVQARDVPDVTAAPPAPATSPAAPPAPLPSPRAPTADTDATPLAPERLASMRAAIASAMARSKREIPHYYLAHDIDVSPARAWLARENEQRAVSDRLLLGVLLLKATARALLRVPELNGHYVDGAFRPGAGVHVGVAIAVRGGGLLAPALLDADQKPLGQLMNELRDLVARARRARLRGAEANSATITVTSLGELGVDAVYGVIQPPQVALLGFGAPRERPWAEHGLLGVRSVLTATLSADHRVSDGLRGAKLLAAIAQALAHPEAL
jgi:pyruvate dehydrogenase E2 component (dihydrolipoamide acetyltransferase)